MKISINTLGDRLQMFRKALDLSQKDLAATVGVQQNLISRLENGIGASLELVLLLVDFYSEHFHINFLLSPDFEVIRKIDALSPMATLNSIAVERLKILQTDFTGQIDEVIGLLEKEGTY